ncbi:uncharacterized protein LOC121372939 [Gigantopelta aegis]|uniref:uncharacterized protein LOC121372939 n=1 Tax=Gigantopelta aegis TaxID=1735272 RepID=UPI001B88E22A|nr:uncharacterized protein LOC121372939 [Gigantopelta aegis]
MKKYPEFNIPSSHIFIIIAAGVLAVNVASQRCELGPVMYKRVFTDKAFVDDAQVTKTGIATRVGCLDVCERSLAEVCTVFVFNQEQQLCKIYKQSLNQLTQVNQMGSVGFVLAEATCPAPPSLPNGKVTYNSTVVGSTATYSCDADYQFFGLNQSSVCETTRAWNALNGSCKQVFFYNITPPHDITLPGLVRPGWKVEAIATPRRPQRSVYGITRFMGLPGLRDDPVYGIIRFTAVHGIPYQFQVWGGT